MTAGSSLLCMLFSSSGEWLLFSRCMAQASHCSGFSRCRAWAQGRGGCSSCGMQAPQLQLPGSRAQAEQVWCIVLVGSLHVVSSQIRDQTYVFCIGRHILYNRGSRNIDRPGNIFFIRYIYFINIFPSFWLIVLFF